MQAFNRSRPAWTFSSSIPARAARLCYGFELRFTRTASTLASAKSEPKEFHRVAEKNVLVGMIPEVVVLDPGDQAVWYSNAGNLKVEFDPQRCPFSSNVLQAPPGIRLASGPSRPGLNSGSFKYRLFLNDVMVAQGEVLIRAKER
jgi:hypothetical protein